MAESIMKKGRRFSINTTLRKLVQASSYIWCKDTVFKKAMGTMSRNQNCLHKSSSSSNLFNGKSHLSEEDLEEIAESLSIGKPSKTSEVSSLSGGHDDHNHRRRRSAGSASAASHALHRRAADPHDHGHQTNGGSGTVSCIVVLQSIRA